MNVIEHLRLPLALEGLKDTESSDNQSTIVIRMDFQGHYDNARFLWGFGV
jgi:hypothetical protein